MKSEQVFEGVVSFHLEMMNLLKSNYISKEQQV